MSAIKRNLLYVGAVIVLVLAVIAFVFLPAFGGAVTGESVVFGKWNGKPIEYVQDSYFVRQMQATEDRMKQQGQQINDYSYYQIMQTAFSATAVRFFVQDELSKVGYKVPQSLVNKSLLPYYQDENGRYSSRIFSETPEATRASRRKVMTEELTAQRYVEDLFGDSNSLYGLKTATGETEYVKEMAGPERLFSYVVFSTSNYPDDQAKLWGLKNPDLFVTHDLSVLTFDSEAAAKKTVASLSKNEYSFEEAVTTQSTRAGTDDDGKLVKNTRNELNKLFPEAKDLDAVLALAPLSVSGVLKTSRGFAIVRCDSAAAPADFNKPEVLAAVKEHIAANEKGTIEDYFTAQAASFVETARTAGFSEAALAQNLEIKTTTGFPINYGGVNIITTLPSDVNTELASASKSESFFKTAFTLQAGAVSDPILLDSNVIVLQLLEEKAADTQFSEMIPMFYSYYASSWMEQSLTKRVLADERLEDEFLATYLAKFLN